MKLESQTGDGGGFLKQRSYVPYFQLQEPQLDLPLGELITVLDLLAD